MTKNQLADILRADSLQGGMAMAIKAGNHPEQVTLSAIKADGGSIGGHTRLTADVWYR